MNRPAESAQASSPNPQRGSEPYRQPGGSILLAATPIGDVRDASPRVVEALQGADIVAAEDTRRALALASRLGITLGGRLVALHDHNEAAKAAGIVEAAQGGARVVFVSDAGMPTVSDPGFRLARAAIDADVPLSVLPGPSAPPRRARPVRPALRPLRFRGVPAAQGRGGHALPAGPGHRPAHAHLLRVAQARRRHTRAHDRGLRGAAPRRAVPRAHQGLRRGAPRHAGRARGGRGRRARRGDDRRRRVRAQRARRRPRRRGPGARGGRNAPQRRRSRGGRGDGRAQERPLQGRACREVTRPGSLRRSRRAPTSSTRGPARPAPR
ncbi:S-adenosylmethionine-dependent methyltransferase, YraL family [Actinomyces sp. oral taxon 172 str. F0311]|nr:S-adenosylmethionine-dependent methyltransferase, YraL family [Actinomyces sp. oral taxon 172 str. F0311]